MKIIILAFLTVLAIVTATPDPWWRKYRQGWKPAPSVSTSPIPPTPSPSSSPIPPSPTPSTSPVTVKPKKNPLSPRLEELRKKLIAVGGCNANICFAIDGSGSINEKEFTNQKQFVLDVATVIGVDEPVEFAAVQYATGNTAITPLTVDTDKFILKVNAAKQRGGASFLAAGINYCFSQLWRRRGEANKIVMLGDGRSTLGADAVKRANLFRRVGGEVTVVAAGFPDDNKLLALAGYKPDNVLEVTSFLDVLALQELVGDLVADVCDVHIH